MSANETEAKNAAIARANLNTWGAVVALLESGLLSGPSSHHYRASSSVIKIAKAQMQSELVRYDIALARLKPPNVGIQRAPPLGAPLK